MQGKECDSVLRRRLWQGALRDETKKRLRRRLTQNSLWRLLPSLVLLEFCKQAKKELQFAYLLLGSCWPQLRAQSATVSAFTCSNKILDLF